jgi:serine/threonine-protein kinase
MVRAERPATSASNPRRRPAGPIMNQHPAYELFEELGRGSNTVVYRSYDLSLGREVAIKELDENSRRDVRQKERFLREAQFLAQFEHDNVLRVYTVDAERGWIVMELMKGTLASIIAAGPSDPDLVRSVLKQTLEALAFLHEKNKVHSTVRPTNLLINEAGRVKLSEFEQTAAGGELRAPKGSKKYLAPELIKPEFGEFGPPLDLYCLGFTALELLKGPPFESLFPGTGKGAIDADMAWLRWHSSPDDLPPTKKLVKHIPDDLANVLDRMLKKRVADRPQSAQEVLKQLEDKPLIAVPVAGVEESALAGEENRHYAPGVVRTLAGGQTVSPRGMNPAVAPIDPGMPLKSASPKTAKPARGKKAAPARFSKDWWNLQLGRWYVLYPLCALMILSALYVVFGNPFEAPPAAQPAQQVKQVPLSPKPAAPATPALIPVTFVATPDANGLEVIAGDIRVPANKEGKYAFAAGHYSLKLNKDGFHPLTREVDISPTSDKFELKFEPTIKYVNIAINVVPVNAELKIADAKQTLKDGSITQKLEEGQPLELEAALDKYVTVKRTISADELKKLGNKVSIELEKEKPRVPASLVAKPGAPLDADLQFPTHVYAKRLGKSEPLEMVLVKPGSYKFGAPADKKRPNEIAERTVQIEQPYYIAIHETTNAQYLKFFGDAGESKAGGRWQTASRKWATSQKVDPTKNHLPVTNLSAEQAQAFCTWAGGQLPTEIEWECAVRGADDKGFPYPWGSSAIAGDRCKIFEGEHLEKGEGGPVDVDMLPNGANALGLKHTIGNAAEWCLDSERRGSVILRGCSIATANTNEIRVTWRAHGDVKGEESNGFRMVVRISDADSPALQKTAEPKPAASVPKVASTASTARPKENAVVKQPAPATQQAPSFGLLDLFSSPTKE